jgi:chlorite dismutase
LIPPQLNAITVSSSMPMEPLRVTFVGGESGQWSVARMDAIKGASIEPVARLAIIEGPNDSKSLGSGSWILRGVVSHERYVTADEHKVLATQEAPLGRSSSTSAALIPIRKSAEWWRLSQDQRRAIFAERSHHISRSLAYLPRIARRLHHSRDLGEPFDFLTWFEFAPNDESAFDELVGMLRATEEWTYVEREVDLRLTRGRG